MKDLSALSLQAANKLPLLRAFPLLLLVFGALQSTFANAQPSDYEPGIHGFVTIATDNRFRGNTLSAGDAALIANFDIVTNKYIYAGVETSNIGNVNLNNLVRQAKISMYGGLKGPIIDGLNFDVRYSHNLNYDLRNEHKLPGGYGELSFGVETKGIKASIAYSDNFQFNTGSYVYPSADFDMSLFSIVDLNLHAGFNKFLDKGIVVETSNTEPIRPGFPDYLDWKAGVTLNIFSSTKLSFALIGTDLSDTYCGALESCDAKLVVSLTKVL